MTAPRRVRRFLQRLLTACAVFVAIAAGAAAMPTDFVGGPSLGFSPNADGSVVWPILGIPGAAQLGRRLPYGIGISGAVVSPRQDYLVAIRTEDGQPVIGRLTTDSIEPVAIDGAKAGGTRIAISPAGAAVALYNAESKTLQVLRGFPENPSVAFEVDARPVDGQVATLAVSDDAALVLMGFVGNGSDSLWAVSASSAQFVSATRASALAFIVNRHDVVVADSVAGEAFLLHDGDYAGARTTLVSRADGMDGIVGAAASDDGKYVVVAGAASGTVAVLDMEKSLRTVVRCNCKPAGVYRMSGTAVFRLTEPPDGLTTILDLSSGKPRVLVIPPEPKTDPRKGVSR